MKILKIWIFSYSGQQLFFKEYDNSQINIISDLLNTSAIHSFVTFFKVNLVGKYCDFILFDDILFIFDYMLDESLKFVTLIITKIDKKVDFETQSKVLKKVATSISMDFYECYNEVIEEVKGSLTFFIPFGERCDNILYTIAKESLAVRINGF